MTSKAAHHIKLHKNLICKWVQDKLLWVCHVLGKINPDEMFRKEMSDGAHFCCLCDSVMSWLSDFLNKSLLAFHHAQQPSPNCLIPTAAQMALSNSFSSYFTALTSSFSVALHQISLICAVPDGIYFAESMGLSLLAFSDLYMFLSSFPKVFFSLGNPLTFAFLFAGCKDGGCWSVLSPFSRVSRSKHMLNFLTSIFWGNHVCPGCTKGCL
jgi:hypothetical protein